ncbi:MAG: hypothetical protein ACI8UO_003085 [Verrucomicrobiales bacterium]|jgi:hypothetical protein
MKILYTSLLALALVPILADIPPERPVDKDEDSGKAGCRGKAESNIAFVVGS